VRVLVDGQTDRQTHTHTLTDANRFYNLSHAICYSYGTDNNCSELMLHFQSLLDLGMLGICIQQHIVANIFIQRLQTFSINVMFLTVFIVF